MKNLVKIFPNLTTQNIKGQNGRIGVVGGSY
jgi:NAD(P)H-hydrate repair Nnr-like enzyme with NAD(P)H-hydrate dehydratase domain